MEIVRLTPDDAQRCLTLGQSVGWQHHMLKTWQTLLKWSKNGAFGMEVNGQLIATTVTITYGKDRAWISMVITHPDFTRQGYATELNRNAIQYLQEYGVREIWLDASGAGRPVYERLGFRAMDEIKIWQGIASSTKENGARLSPLTFSHMPQAIKFDSEVFGASRPQFFSRQLEEFPDLAWIDRVDGKIRGLILAQEEMNDRRAHIGIWSHENPQGAEALFRTACHALAGQEIYVQVPESNGEATAIVQKYGLEHVGGCTRMLYGDVTPALTNSAFYYGIGAFMVG